MKNLQQTVSSNTNNVYAFKLAAIILWFLMSRTIVFGQSYKYKTNSIPQRTKVGMGIERYISGNGHGSFYSAYLLVTKGKNVFFGGPIVQKRTMTVGGAKLGYSRILTGNNIHEKDEEGENVDQRIQLNAFGYVQYSNNLPLSYTSQQIEESCNRAMDYDWSKLRLSTAEMCLGFEIHYKFNENISWRSYFGVSVYNHLNYKPGMYQEKVKGVLLLGTGINIRSFKKN